jgi:hypothetical protein
MPEVDSSVGFFPKWSIADLLRDLDPLCPPGPEFSIMRTKLEEACMFGKKAISVDPRYQMATPGGRPERTRAEKGFAPRVRCKRK